MKTLADLPIGAKISFGRYRVEDEDLQDIVWVKADQNHEGYPENSVTLVTEKIIDLRAFDAKESNNDYINIQCYGNNSYPVSNCRQWLNSDKEDWYKPQHSADTQPSNWNIKYETGYFIHPGFLYDFTEQEKNAILPTTIPVLDDEIVVTVRDLVFPLSKAEVGLGYKNGAIEGSKLALFSGNTSRVAYLTEQCFDNTKSTNKPSAVSNAWHWWLRTPHSGSSCYVCTVNSSGSLNNYNAFYGYFGVRPALNLSVNTLISDYPDKDGCYDICIYPLFQIVNNNILSKNTDLELIKLILQIANNTKIDEHREICYFEAMKAMMNREDLSSEFLDRFLNRR